MPLVEFESVVSVSSEDAFFPAKNLIKSAIGNNLKKWICGKKGEKNVSAIFQFKEKVEITNIVVGNENTAIIEILVMNNGWTEEECQVLLPATEIQTVRDVRKGENKNGVHLFSVNDFKSEVAEREWERIKVVCNQPYDSYSRFGLSCFIVKSIKKEDGDVDEDVEEDLKSENDLPDEEKEKLNTWRDEVLQRLPDASSSSVAKVEPKPSSSPKRKLSTSDDDSPSAKKRKTMPKDRAENEASTSSSPSKYSNTKKQKPPPSKVEFYKIMADVRFSMSGYENPLRSELRNKAMDMGAKYFADLNSSCTHLVCAYINTPKFSQAKSSGIGKIVVKDWIEMCHSQRKRLPWRRFALVMKERNLPISEEDDVEEKDEEPSKRKKNEESNKKKIDRRKRLPSSSSSDSEAEVERVRARIEKRKQTTNKKPVNKQQNVNDIYNADTEEEEDIGDIDFDDTDADEDYVPDKSQSTDDSLQSDVVLSSSSITDESNAVKMSKKKTKKMVVKKGNVTTNGKRPDTNDIPFPKLPDAPAHNYFIADDEKNDYRDELKRYIYAFNGKGKNEPVPAVSNIFGNHNFYIATDILNRKKERLFDCIDSFQWSVYDELCNEVNFAISDSKDVAKEIITKFPKIKVVKSDWIWKCSDEDSFISPKAYLLV